MLPPGGLAHVRGRLAIATTEGAIEIRKIAESARECDGGDFPALQSRVAQKLGGMFETHFQNVLRETPARLFKQQAQIAGRDTELAGDGCRAQCWIAHAMFDPVKNRGTPHGPY